MHRPTFFKQINYSASNEDSRADRKALQIQQRDRVLCVTGSGARSLDLLIDDPAEIVSIDFNPSQNYLLELKIAAWQLDNHELYSEFLGLSNSRRRLELFDQIKNHLSPACLQFWQRRRRMIRRGVLYGGTWEKYQRWMAKAKIFRFNRVRQLWNAENLEQQCEQWERHWRGAFMRTFLSLISNRFLWVSVLKEPGAKLIPANVNVGGHLMECLDRMVRHSLLRENPWACLLFFGRYLPSCKLPDHLRKENFELIKARVNRIQIVTQSLSEYLYESSLFFDAFSLSDFSSYANADEYVKTWEAVLKRATTGARFCERFFLVTRDGIESQLSHEFRSQLAHRINESEVLSDDLKSVEQTGLYTFRVGTIVE